HQLESGGLSINADLVSTNGLGPDGAGFTLWPATTPGNQYSDDANGTEYFLTSRAVFSEKGASNSILVWRETNNSSLASATPSLSLTPETVSVDEYGRPPRSSQKAGNIPLANCVHDGPAVCGVATGGVPFAGHDPEVQSLLDSNDSRFT